MNTQVPVVCTKPTNNVIRAATTIISAVEWPLATYSAVNWLAGRRWRLQAFDKRDNLVIRHCQLLGGVERLCLELDWEPHCHEPHSSVGVRVVSEANQAVFVAGCFKKVVQAASEMAATAQTNGAKRHPNKETAD
jgi:hypothetical protein